MGATIRSDCGSRARKRITTAQRSMVSLVLAPALLIVACRTPPGRFFHQGHRQAFAISEGELSRLQFYVSTKVLAHDLDAEGPESVILVEQGTPGVAVAAGPEWIRVRFQRGGQGVVFLAVPNARTDSSYLLATETEDGSGYRLVRNEPDRILRVGGRRFRIVSGADAALLVNAGDLRRLIENDRTRLEGQRR